jgi:hypothetical protein
MSDARARRPDGVSDGEVRAAGLMSEAMERVERARGAIFEAHQLIGGADASLDDVVSALHESGHRELAAELARDLVGRNVLDGRWTFEVVEEFDDGFYAHWRKWDRRLRDELTAGERHVLEAELKEQRQAASRIDSR